MVSVIVTTFNPVWEKLKATLRSVIEQKNIEIEIIIADDGSNDNKFSKITIFFQEYEFNNYILIESKENMGTCLNFYRALKVAKYNYIKAISPGDLLYDTSTLKKWYEFASSKDADICFSNAVYYNDKSYEIIECKHNPAYMDIYRNTCGEANCREEYLLLPDPVLGAALLTKKETTIKYMKLIIGKVKYCEDYFIKLFVADGGRLCFFDSITLWYEYGLGISTNAKWEELIKKDKQSCAKILLEYSIMDWRWKRIWQYQAKTGNLPKWRIILFPKLFSYLVTRKKKQHKTPINVDTSFLLNFFNC